MEKTPQTGFKGLVENWQSDLIAAVSVALVALPLGLGIALASGVPPIAGIISAIIGGVVTTFFRGAHIAINGPTAGLIAAILSAIAVLDDGSGKVLSYVFAAVVVSGALQVLLGLLKWGRYADLFHSTVVQGILAAIGVIIIAKQIHFALGTTTTASSILDTLVDAVRQIPNINPFVAIISVLGLLLLVFHSRISFKFFHFIPAPMWVLVISIPIVYLFNFLEPHQIELFGREYSVGPDLLVDIPTNILDAIAFPDFTPIGTWAFWNSVLVITMIASIESLAAAKAVDKLDPYKRKTNLNKDMIGIGISTMVAGAIGGLPIINVIVRSTVNIHNHAKTKWSNFYHGALLLLFIFIMAPAIQKVPLAALAILLVFTGFKLASPKVIRHVYDQGIEQLIFFVGTLLITLATNLLVGIFGGLVLALISHMLLAKVPLRQFFQMIINPGSKIVTTDLGRVNVELKGIANFLVTIKIDKLLQQIPKGSLVNIDLSGVRLVDFSIMEHLYEFKKNHRNTGGTVMFTGLEGHTSSTDHRLGLKIKTNPIRKMTPREKKLVDLAANNDWNFNADYSNHVDYFQSFEFFTSRPVEKKFNIISSSNRQNEWEVVDVLFEEGAFMLLDEHKTTLGMVRFDKQIPRFTIEKKEFVDWLLNLAEHKDIDYELYHDFPKDFTVKVNSEEEMKEFVTEDFKTLVENSECIHHLESNGEAILLFMDNLRLAHLNEYSKIVEFSRKLKRLID